MATRHCVCDGALSSCLESTDTYNKSNNMRERSQAELRLHHDTNRHNDSSTSSQHTGESKPPSHPQSAEIIAPFTADLLRIARMLPPGECPSPQLHPVRGRVTCGRVFLCDARSRA
eukprot:2938498-Prymnesium_polylepis.1